MKIREVIAWLLVIFLIIFNFRNEEIKENSFEINNPEPIIIFDTIHEKGETIIKRKENKVNKELLSKYTKLKDSIKKVEMYKEAITERKYKEVVKDEQLNISIESDVLGTLTNQRVKYKLKEKGGNTGFYLGVNTSFSTGYNKIDVGGQLLYKRKNKIYGIGYDSNENINFSLSIKL